MTLDEARKHVGRRVLYFNGVSHEEGTITSVNDAFVFVRYGSDVGGRATRAEDLDLVRQKP